MKVLIIFSTSLLIACCSTADPEKPKYYYFPNDNNEVVADDLEPGLPSPYQTKEDAAKDISFLHLVNNAKDTDEPKKIEPNCSDDCLSGFLPNVPVVFIVHGFNSGYNYNFGTVLRRGFKIRSEKGELFNMVFVDWSILADSKYNYNGGYFNAVSHVPLVGECTADMIDYIVSKNVTLMNSVFYIGHSLGSHVANYVTANLNVARLEHIVALDPAYPLFGSRNESHRLSPSDAGFVNVIHTASGSYNPMYAEFPLGFSEPLGHVDFYPNDGRIQPGCECDHFGICSHSRSYQLLAESIDYGGSFPACKIDSYDNFLKDCNCETEIIMGWDTVSKNPPHGKYFLKTNRQLPFSKPNKCEHVPSAAAMPVGSVNTFLITYLSLKFIS